MNHNLRFITVLLLSILCSFTVYAQDKTVTGKVISGTDQMPLPGVSVLVKGTSSGTVTNIDGEYTITVPEASNILVYSYIGFKSVEMEIGDQSAIDLTMDEDAQQLSEVVVTAFGIEREKKALGYAVQGVDAKAIQNAPSPNVVNSLSGRVSGMQVTSAGTPGGSPEFVIRGFSSVAGNNQPLIVIDGVPMQQTSNATSGERSDNQQYGGGLSEIDPNNIADISVLKGPNAAALYGSRAANGVILIKTKNGSGTKGIGVEINSTTTFERPAVKPNFQNTYGGGNGYRTWYADGFSGTVDGFKGTAGTDESWGSPMDGREVRQWWTGTETAPLVPNPDNWEEYWETGHTFNNSIAISGANDKGSFRLSMGRLDQKGIMYNNGYWKNNFRLNASQKFTDKLTINAMAEYIKSGSDNRGYLSSSNFIWHHRHVSWDQLKDYEAYEDVHISPDGDTEPPNWQHTYFTNPFFSEDVLTNSNEKDRILGNISLNYEFTDWLSLMVRTGTDVWSDTRINVTGYERIKAGNYAAGSYNEEVLRRQETNSDFIFTINKDISNTFSFNAQLGGINRTNYYKRNYTNVSQLTIDGVYTTSNNASANTDQSSYEESEVNSVFGAAQFGFKNMLFLDITGRNDWSSTLPKENNSFFYPSVSVSAVVSDMIPALSGGVLSFAKLRASWAEVGNDADPYMLQQTFSSDGLWDGSIPKYAESNEIANSTLKPEKTTGLEFGADLRFLNGRIGLDVTYYDQSTQDQILAVDISRASGYETRVLNAGEITNKGVEAMINATILESAGGFSWNMGLNFSKNKNEVVELADGLTSLTLWSIRGASLEARVGEAYGSLYGNKFARTEDGQLIFDDGLPYNIDGQHVIGNIIPDWIGGVSNTFTYKGITLSALIDIKKGGDIYDMGTSIARITGVLNETSVGREEGVIGVGVKNIGTDENPEYVENDVIASATTFYGRYSGRQYHEAAVMDGSYIKLREVSVGYQIPASLLSNIFLQSARISVIGRNLAIFHKNIEHVDPELSSSSLGYNYGQLPSSRSIGFNLNVKF
ncbi:SusC/RagA family TonB-linked outer membrane protein [Chondrinema litorale]|uniref:SusC/RagA family TonB-linked outer membrane protein n=1 Tax=Chondrinema litorale TaxID=2994555 RepID=UPI002542DECA|nr:SusC/RagA family TonB-linked outer membrane protein [Chondrinema litorale]UZR93116.1 SusC/RagA family TonB-linked outer membrane protein [Chondrinema litorale]